MEPCCRRPLRAARCARLSVEVAVQSYSSQRIGLGARLAARSWNRMPVSVTAWEPHAGPPCRPARTTIIIPLGNVSLRAALQEARRQSFWPIVHGCTTAVGIVREHIRERIHGDPRATGDLVGRVAALGTSAERSPCS